VVACVVTEHVLKTRVIRIGIHTQN